MEIGELVRAVGASPEVRRVSPHAEPRPPLPLVSRGSVAHPEGVLDGGQSLPSSSVAVRERPTSPVDLMSFYAVRPISEALMRTGWTVERDIEILVNIAEYGEQDSDRLRARAQLRELVNEALLANNQLVQAELSARSDGDGNVTHSVTVKASGVGDAISQLSAKFGRKETKTDVHNPNDALGGDASPGLPQLPELRERVEEATPSDE